jgi:hypothetical protein
MKKNKLQMKLIRLSLAFLLFLFSEKIIAQDTTKIVAQDTANLMSQLENESGENKIIYTTSTFKYTRINNGHSVENLPARVLDVRISHRFGPLSRGVYQFFGLDASSFNVRIGFDYGITNNFMIGIGHNAWQKTYDGFFKLKILRQSTGAVKMPFSVSFVPTFALATIKAKDFGYVHTDTTANEKDRFSYVLQLLIARKFSEGFSLQLMPTFIHADNTSFDHYRNGEFERDIWALGVGATQKISKRMSINIEYYYQLPATQATASTNVFSFGIDLGTGGHVFQLDFTNSFGLTEKSFISEVAKHGDGSGLRFGFNISRVFQLGKKHNGNSAWKKN